MGDMRKDYVAERFMIVSKNGEKSNSKKSPFAPGNESMTNPSVLSLVAKDGMLQRLQDSDDEFVEGWSIRVFESKNPIVSVETENSYSDRPFYSEPAYGYHYIVVASPNPKDTFATIDTEQWSNILVVVQDRLRWLYTQKGVTYVSIYANQGEAAGRRGRPRCGPRLRVRRHSCRRVARARGSRGQSSRWRVLPRAPGRRPRSL